MLGNIIYDFALYVGGNLCLAEVEECKLPTLKIKTEEFEAGGMLAPVDVPLGAIEKMEAEMTFHSFNASVLSEFNIYPGANISVVLRGSMVDLDGTKKPAKASMIGHFDEPDIDAIKAHQKVQVKYKFLPTYYKLELNSSLIYEIDVVNYVCIVNNHDLVAEARNHMGL